MRHRGLGLIDIIIGLVILIFAIYAGRLLFMYFTDPSIEEISQSDEWEAVEIEVLNIEIDEDDEGSDSHSIEVESRYGGKIISGEFSSAGNVRKGIEVGAILDGYVNVESYDLAYDNYRTAFNGANADTLIFSIITFSILAVISLVCTIIKKMFRR